MTTINRVLLPESNRNLPPIVLVNMIWNLVILAGSLWLAASIFQGSERLAVLGRDVQIFLGLVALIPAALVVYTDLQLLRRKPGGRFGALALSYVAMALSGFALLSLWGVFSGIDAFSQALLENVQWTWGLMLAYALFWFAGRLKEKSPVRGLLERLSVAVGMLSLVLLLWNMGLLEAVNSILNRYADPLVWAVTGVMLFAGFMAYAMMRLHTYFGETLQQKEAWQGWVLLSPNIIGFGIFFAGPLLLSLYLGFTNDTVGSVPEFIGLQNYGEILALQIHEVPDGATAQSALDRGYTALWEFSLGNTLYTLGARDPMFWQSLRNTFVFVLILIPLSTIPALALALILNSKLPGMKLFRGIYFLPSVAAVVGTAIVWGWLYNPVIGYINYAITQVVNFLNATFGATIVDPRIEWISDQRVVLISIVILAAWQTVGFNMVLFLAGLQGIPNILYEAAFVDGANAWQRFRNVTWPMLAPTSFFIIVTTVIKGLQVFNEPYALIPFRPMPVAATTSVYYLYNRGFFRFQFGYASSVAWILFALIFAVTFIQFRMSRSGAYES